MAQIFKRIKKIDKPKVLKKTVNRPSVLYSLFMINGSAQFHKKSLTIWLSYDLLTVVNRHEIVHTVQNLT